MPVLSESTAADPASQLSFVFVPDSCPLRSQAKQEELEELNKELRQCNLQQFIQQTGVLPAHSHSRTDLQEQLDQLELAQFLANDEYRNGSMDTEINIRVTNKQQRLHC